MSARAVAQHQAWRVVESSSVPKPGRANEDVIAVGEHFIVLCDGTTAKHPVRLAGQTPGAFAAQHAARTVLTLDPDITLPDAVSAVAASLKRAAESHGFVGAEVEPPSTTMTVVSFARDEVWNIGSAMLRRDDEHHTFPGPPSDVTIARFRDLYQSLLLARGGEPAELLETDPAHDLVMPVLSLQWYVRNDASSPWGYGSIDGSDVPARYQDCLSLEGIQRLVVVSDGYLSAAPTLAAAEAELAELVGRDPLLLTGPGTRTRPTPDSVAFDDRSYLRLVR